MGFFDEVNKPQNVVVSHNENIKGPTGRLISKNVLKKACENNCVYKKDCWHFTSDYAEKDIECYKGWKLTIGKGKKVY